MARKSRPAVNGAAESKLAGTDHHIVTARADSRSDAPFQLLPALAEAEYAALKADIAGRGIIVAVVVDQHGRILDGHHRRRVADELGIDCPTTTRIVTSDEDAADLAVSLNAARRHLSREQRRDLIGAEILRRPDDSDRAVARRVGCDHKTVGSVRREQRGEVPHDDDETLRSIQARIAGLKATYDVIGVTDYDDPGEHIRALLGVKKAARDLANEAVEYQAHCERRQGQLLNDAASMNTTMSRTEAETLTAETREAMQQVIEPLSALCIQAMSNKISATEIADAIRAQYDTFGADLPENTAAPVREAMFGPVLDWLADPATAEQWRPHWDHPTFQPLTDLEREAVLDALAGSAP